MTLGLFFEHRKNIVYPPGKIRGLKSTDKPEPSQKRTQLLNNCRNIPPYTGGGFKSGQLELSYFIRRHFCVSLTYADCFELWFIVWLCDHRKICINYIGLFCYFVVDPVTLGESKSENLAIKIWVIYNDI